MAIPELAKFKKQLDELLIARFIRPAKGALWGPCTISKEERSDTPTMDRL